MNILVIRLDEIGDFVLTTPFLRELKKNYPSSSITLVVKPQVKNLAETCPYVDCVLSYKKSWHSMLFALMHLRKMKFELVFLPRWDQDTYGALELAKQSRAKRQIGYFDQALKVSQKKRHEVEKNLHLLTLKGKKIESTHVELWLTSADRAKAKKIIEGLPEPIVALGIGASKARKVWPLSHFKEVTSQLEASFVVIGGPEDFSAGNELDALNLAGTLTLRESAAVIEQCDLFIGNDSGPMHMAAAVRTPVVEISCHPENGKEECEYSPARFGPWTENMVVAQPKEFTSPCQEICRCDRAHCILGVTPTSVVKLASLWLPQSAASVCDKKV